MLLFLQRRCTRRRGRRDFHCGLENLRAELHTTAAAATAAVRRGREEGKLALQFAKKKRLPDQYWRLQWYFWGIAEVFRGKIVALVSIMSWFLPQRFTLLWGREDRCLDATSSILVGFLRFLLFRGRESGGRGGGGNNQKQNFYFPKLLKKK